MGPTIKLVEQAKIYPLGGEATAKKMLFPDGSGVAVDMLPLRNGSAFVALKNLLDEEGTNLAGPDWLGMLASIGIVQGQPFQPDAATQHILDDAAKTGYNMSRAIAFQNVVSGRSFKVYPDRIWLNPMADATPSNPGGPFNLSWQRVAEGYTDLQTRIWYFTDYYAFSPGMISQMFLADGAPDKTELTIATDKATAFQHFITVVDAARKAGIIDIGIAAQPVDSGD